MLTKTSGSAGGFIFCFEIEKVFTSGRFNIKNINSKNLQVIYIAKTVEYPSIIVNNILHC